MRNKAHAFLLVIVIMLVGGAVAGIVLLYPSTVPNDAAAVTDQGVRLLDGRITGLEEVAAPQDSQILPPGSQELAVTAELSSGDEVTFSMVDETGDTFSVGQRVRIAETESPDGGDPLYYIADIKREQPLLILTAAFLAVVLLFGRWQGLRALIGLGITLAVVVLFLVPAVLAGRDPILVALSASVAIMAVTLFVTHGLQAKTTAAVVGTLGALGVTVGLSWLFIQFASLTGLASEEARLANVEVGGLSLRGLLLAGIIIGACGVLDDVTMAQSSTVFEFRSADPLAASSQLYSRAMTVGRDHVGATINTLVLAYAGASLPLLILFSSSPDSMSVIVSSEVVAIEIVRTLVGSIGLMVSVPLTTMLAAWLARPSKPDIIARPATVEDDEDDQPYVPDDVFTGARPFSADDDVESDWERRLRDSYGLDRLRAARRREQD